MKCCSTCGQGLPPEVNVGGPVRQRVFDYIAKHPEGVTTQQVLDHVYVDDPNGGPDSGNVVSVHVTNINRRLSGMKIKARGGPASIYQLVKTLDRTKTPE